MVNKPELRDGSEWIDHEDYLVADEAGLKRLRDACDAALRDGIYSGGDLGQWVGIKKLESTWFEHPEDRPQTKFANSLIGFVLVGLLAIFVIGVVSIFRWIF